VLGNASAMQAAPRLPGRSRGWLQLASV